MKKRRIVEPGLTDREWQELSTLCSLPDAARPKVNGVIKRLRDNRKLENPWGPILKDARSAMKSARSDLRRAISSVTRLSRTEAPSFMGKKWHPEGPFESARPKISAVLNAMQQLAEFFPPDETGIPRAPAGRGRSNLQMAIFQLSHILKTYSSTPLNHSGHLLHIAQLVCKKGQPETTALAVKEHIKRIRRRDRPHGSK